MNEKTEDRSGARLDTGGREGSAGTEARIDALETENAALQAELERRAEVLLAYEQEIDDLARAVTDLSARAAKLEDDLKGARSAMQTQNESAALLAEARTERERLLRRRSYGMTAPFRRLKSLLSKW